MSEYWKFGFTKDSFMAYVSTMSASQDRILLYMQMGVYGGCVTLTAGPVAACSSL